MIRVLACGAAVAAMLCACHTGPTDQSRTGTVDVRMCDNKTTMEARPGQTPEEGQKISDSLMAQWRLNHPGETWEEDVLRSHPEVPRPFDNSHLLAKGQGEGQTYGAFRPEDIALWERETYRSVLEGARVFHSAKELGSTIAVSCDMCHPDASNTHPETYPKYQVQLGRVVLLRDMINWCLEHPVRAQPLAPDDPRMRVLESYILAQRSGKTLEYGRH